MVYGLPATVSPAVRLYVAVTPSEERNPASVPVEGVASTQRAAGDLVGQLRVGVTIHLALCVRRHLDATLQHIDRDVLAGIVVVGRVRRGKVHMQGLPVTGVEHGPGRWSVYEGARHRIAVISRRCVEVGRAKGRSVHDVRRVVPGDDRRGLDG